MRAKVLFASSTWAFAGLAANVAKKGAGPHLAEEKLWTLEVGRTATRLFDIFLDCQGSLCVEEQGPMWALDRLRVRMSLWALLPMLASGLWT